MKDIEEKVENLRTIRQINCLVFICTFLFIFCVGLVYSVQQLSSQLENDRIKRNSENEANLRVMESTKEVLKQHQDRIEQDGKNIKGLIEVIKLRDEVEALKQQKNETLDRNSY